MNKEYKLVTEQIIIMTVNLKIYGQGLIVFFFHFAMIITGFIISIISTNTK